MDSILDELIHLVAVKGGSTGSTLHETLSFLPYSDLKYWEYAFHFIRNISSFEITNLPATQIPFDDLVSQLGHSIRVIASLETRRKFLLGAQESTPNGILSDINFSILALVAKYTSIGATMIDIAKELNIDPRSLFAYVKALVERGFVVKFPVVVKGSSTNLVIHVNYCNDNRQYVQHQYDLVPEKELPDAGNYRAAAFTHTEAIKFRVTQLLQDATNNVLAVTDLSSIIKREFSLDSKDNKFLSRTFRDIEEAGWVERIEVGIEKIVKCFRLLKMYESERKTVQEFEQGGILCDVPLSQQIYDFIDRSGKDGVTTVQIRNYFKILSAKFLEKLLIKIAAPAKPIQGILGIYKRAEFEGKSRRYFYYSKQENLPGDGATAKATSSKSSTKRKDDFVVSDDDQVQVVEPVKKKTKSVTESNPNNKRMSQTAERRQELLIEILEKIKVIEVGKVLETAFNEVLIEKGEETKTRIDKKTFMRSLKTMEDSGIVKFHIVAVPQMNGAFASKTIVFHTSVDLESNQVQQYISKMANKNCTLTGKSKKVLIKIKDVQIERLDSSANKIEPESEIITTDNFNAPIDNTYFSYGQSHVGFDNSFLENPYLSLLSGVQTPPMDDYCSTPMSFTPLNSQALNFTPLSIVSEEFIAPLPIYQESVATNLNAPVIEPAVSTLQNKSEAGWSITIGEENGFINARMLRSKAVHEFLINKLTDSETRSIKNNGVFSFGMLFRDITLDLFLKIIGVFVKSADLDDYLTNSGSRDIMIKDLVGPIRSIIYSKVYKLRSGITKVIETLEIIQVLQSFNGDADCEDRQYKLNLHIPLHDYSAPGSPFLHFCSNVETIEAVASFWSILEFTCCKSSVSNDALITQEDTEKDIEKSDSKGDISWITRTRNWKLPLNFSSRQQIYLKQFVNEVTGSTPIEDQAKCLEIAQELELPVSRVTLYFSRFDSNFQQKKKVKLGKIKKSGKKLIEEPKSIKSIKDDFNVIPELNLKIKKPRFKFTPEVDNTLLIGHAICIKLLKNRSNFWAPIVKLFNGEASSSTCRTRHTVLKKKEVNNEFSRKIEAEFSDWFDLQVESGSAFLLDPELLDPELLDISGYVQRYIHQPEELKSIQVSGSVVCLPDSAKVFEDLYDISVTNPRVDVFQSLLNNVASKQKLSYLRSQSLTSGIKKEILDHSDVDAEDDLGIRLCESLMKEEVYDAKNVFQKMSLLPINLVSNSIQSLTLGNTILRKSAESREVSRPVAGRGYRLSDRVMNLLTGPFDSSLFTEATEFRKNLESEKSLEIKEQASSGHVAHLLDALACGKIKLSFKSEDVLVLNSSSLKVVASLDQTSRKRVRDDDSMEDDPDCADASSSVARLDSCLIEFDDVSHLSEGPVLEVYTCVVNSAKIGISFVSIQTETGLESQLIRSTLQTLVSYSLVYRVGFKSCVYVSKDNYKYWTVSTSLNESGDSFDESIRTLPFVWYNFNGSFNFQVYNACVTTILSMVIKRPGIYESALVSSFSSFLCAVEVGEILSDLIGRGSIFKKSMLMEGSMNDFASFQKVTVALVDNDVVDDGKISCYYPQVAIF